MSPKEGRVIYETVSMCHIFAGKKVYLDLLCTRFKDGDRMMYAVKPHVRCKGVPEASIWYEADSRFEGDVVSLYTDLYLGKPTEFDLTCGETKPSLRVDLGTQQYVLVKEFERVLQCTPSKHAFDVIEELYSDSTVGESRKRKRD